MRFFRMSPADLRECSEADLQVLLHYKHVIHARERLERISDTACAFSSEDEAMEHRLNLAETAYRDNERAYANAVVKLSRRR